MDYEYQEQCQFRDLFLAVRFEAAADKDAKTAEQDN